MKLTQEMARMILTRRSVDRLILAARTLCVLVLIALVANGCASFAGQRLPTVDSIPSRAHFTNKPSVYFALRFVSDLSGGKNPPIEHAEPLPTMREIVDRVATQSGLFRSHTFESFQAGTTDYTFQLEMLNHGSIGAAVGAGAAAAAVGAGAAVGGAVAAPPHAVSTTATTSARAIRGPTLGRLLLCMGTSLQLCVTATMAALHITRASQVLETGD